MKGMIQRDDGGGLGHAVTLDEHESESVPELLERARESAAAGDKCPELKAECTMHATEAPPAAPTFDRLGRGARQGWDRRIQDGLSAGPECGVPRRERSVRRE